MYILTMTSLATKSLTTMHYYQTCQPSQIFPGFSRISAPSPGFLEIILFPLERAISLNLEQRMFYVLHLLRVTVSAAEWLPCNR